MLSVKHYISNPKSAAISALKHFGSWLPDKIYLKWMFRLKMGKKLDLRNPQTFSEKLQWLKLYNRRPEYIQMVDKYAVKDYVAKIIGNEYIIPTLGVWDKPEEIDWDSLPDKFVLKTTHGGGSTGVVICRDKSTFDRENAIKRLRYSLENDDIYRTLKEWPYKKVIKRIIAEKYIEPKPDINDLPDYKFFCFNGEPKYCQVISGRGTNMCIDFFDHEWNHQPFHEPRKYPFAGVEPKKPKCYEKMWGLARNLAQDKAFSRIDFYEIGDDVYFGEITFYPTSGFGGFNPTDYDTMLGKMIDLSSVSPGARQ